MQEAVEPRGVEHGARVLDEWTIVGLALVVAVTALAYVAVSALLGGSIDALETTIFVAVFTATYVAFARYL